MIDTWHAVLQLTGGDLKYSKCYWTLQDYQWNNGVCFLKIDTDKTLLLTDNGNRKALEHIPADVARVLVGVLICPSHKEKPVVDILNDKIAGYIEKLSSCTLNAQDVYFGYQYYWWASLRYATPVISFSLAYNHLALLHRALLPKLRVVRTFPIVMRLCPLSLGGLGLHSIEFESLAQAINLFVSLHTVDTPAKQLLRVSIELIQLEAGTMGDVLSQDFDKYDGLITDSWLVSLWRNLSRFWIYLTLPDEKSPLFGQEKDLTVTEVALSQGYSLSQRQSINKVRLYLQVIFFSDMVIPGHNTIKSCFRQGCLDVSSVIIFHWPLSIPSKQDIIIWMSFINSVSHADGSLLYPVQWVDFTRCHRRSTALISDDRTHVRVVHKGNLLFF